MSNPPTKTSAPTALAAIAPATKMTANSGAPGAVGGALGESRPVVSAMSSAPNTTISATDAMNIAAEACGLANIPAGVETAIGSIPTAVSNLGATTTNLRKQWTYVSSPSGSLTMGVGSLVDANMNEAAAKLATLEVQQQLRVQALSISHSNAQLTRKLLELYNSIIGK